MVVIDRAIGRSDNDDRAERAREGATGSSLLANGFQQSLLRLVGLDWSVLDFSTLCHRQETLNVSLPYRGGTGPLTLLIPSHRCKQRLPGSGQHGPQSRGCR